MSYNPFTESEIDLIEKLGKPPECMHDPEFIIDNGDSWQCNKCGLRANKTFSEKIWQKNIVERLEKLEKNNSNQEKYPHICPVCDGKKKTKEISKSTIKLHDNNVCKNLIPHDAWNMCCSCNGAIFHEYENCNICEGTGIVWG